jgi:hypothetical protein
LEGDELEDLGVNGLKQMWNVKRYKKFWEELVA